MMPKPIILMILDGWGYSEDLKGNTVKAAHTPNFDRLWKSHPHILLSASGLDVGLPKGQMGNSEVGHLHIGAGRAVPQNLTRIDLEIENVAYPPIDFTNVLGEVITNNNLKQLKIAETEKYAHVTYFSNGGNETPFPNRSS